MKRAAAALLLALLGGCAHQDLKPPCSHPAALLGLGGCGPLHPVQ